MFFVEVLLLGLLIYLAAGFLFAIVFIIKGVTVIDKGATGSGWGFRLIIIPGTIVFWPLLLMKWTKMVKQKRHD